MAWKKAAWHTGCFSVWPQHLSSNVPLCILCPRGPHSSLFYNGLNQHSFIHLSIFIGHLLCPHPSARCCLPLVPPGVLSGSNALHLFHPKGNSCCFLPVWQPLPLLLLTAPQFFSGEPPLPYSQVPGFWVDWHQPTLDPVSCSSDSRWTCDPSQTYEIIRSIQPK